MRRSRGWMARIERLRPWSRVILLIAVSSVFAACDGLLSQPPRTEHFFGARAPELVNQKLAAKTRRIDYEAFSLLHSGVTRSSLWAAERLTREGIQAARGLKRKNSFHPDEHLPPSERAELADYQQSGYDRGHLAPSGNMPTESAQRECFTLANMIPQNSDNNQHIWEEIESGVRNLAIQAEELYVITGPIYEGDSLSRIGDRVLVPSAVYKAVLNPRTQGAAAYVTPNEPGRVYEICTIAELEARLGINLFPALPDAVKAKKGELPKPSSRTRSRSKR